MLAGTQGNASLVWLLEPSWMISWYGRKGGMGWRTSLPSDKWAEYNPTGTSAVVTTIE
jgi:hypothetical protein